jgi:hypothetical protein
VDAWYSKGDGTFWHRATIASGDYIGINSGSLHVASLKEDPWPDIIFKDFTSPGYPYDGDTHVCLGSQRAYECETTLPGIGGVGGFLRLADVNGDGHLDAVEGDGFSGSPPLALPPLPAALTC